MTLEIAPFLVSVPQPDLDDLHERLTRARWPDPAPAPGWAQGVPLAILRELCAYWGDTYDWRAREARLNAYPQFVTDLDGLNIHFLHVRSAEPDAMPLIMTHGWPGTVFEFLDVLDTLVNPARHGGRGSDAFHIVCPSLPGYGWSGKPADVGWGIDRTARAWRTLMERLGYRRFAAHGGDWGSRVSTALAALYPDRVLGIHLTMPLALPAEGQSEFDDAEQQALAALSHYQHEESGYAAVQSTRPQTLGYALHDSPVGQCAWMLEKFCSWSDTGNDPIGALGADRLLDQITTYWLTGSATSSVRYYWENRARSRSSSQSRTSSAGPEAASRAVTVPAGISQFPKELFRPPRHWVERQYLNLRYWNEPGCGGHFPALEQPSLFVSELQDFFRMLR